MTAAAFFALGIEAEWRKRACKAWFRSSRKPGPQGNATPKRVSGMHVLKFVVKIHILRQRKYQEQNRFKAREFRDPGPLTMAESCLP